MPLAPPGNLVRVWSLPVRIAHWSLAAMAIYDFVDDSGGKLHRYVGYAAAIVVVLRLLYGLRAAAGTARILFPTPSECFRHLRQMATGRVPRLAGHNPFGAAMTLALWTLVIALALSGSVSRWDMFWGEDWPVDIHAWLAYTLLACVLLHLVGVIISSLLERQNLVRGMVTGTKYIDAPPPPHVNTTQPKKNSPL
jgi:cytochrome b